MIDFCMKKLILISLVISFAICSRSWAEDKINISDGIWHGSLPISGNILCDALLNKIVIKNNKVAVKGIDIIGPINYKFNLNENKYENKFFKINNITNRYKFIYLEKENQIKLSFNGACVGEEIFKLDKQEKTFEELLSEFELSKENSKLEEKLSIKSKVLFIENKCKEMGLVDNEMLYNKCIVTLLKSFDNFK